jgi:predicted ATPase
MLAGLFGLETISEEFNELVYHDTEGNPFFIEEVIRSLIEQEQIYREEDRWERKEIAELTIPQSIREAIGRRLNRLSKPCIDVLHIAAALGKTFEFRELAAVTDFDEDTLIDALDEASQAQVIYSDKAEAFTFTHDKIREVLYEELNPIRRRRLHQRIGEGLAAMYESNLDTHTQELAYHFIESGDLEQGLIFARRAATLSEKIYAHDEAIYYYTRAAECAEALNLNGQLLEINEASGDVYYRTGPFEKAVEYYQRAIELATTQAQRAELNIKIGATYALIGDERGLEYLKSALNQLDPTQIEAQARALAMLGRFHHYHGHGQEALSYLEQARQLAEPLDNTGLLTDIYSYLAGAHQWWGDIQDSNAWARRTLEFGEARHSMLAVALGYEFLSENATITGRWQEAIEHAERNRTIGEKIGSYERMAWADMSTTFAYHNLGNLKTALQTANHGILLSERIGDVRLELIMHTERAKLAADLDDDDLLKSDLAAVEELAKNSSQFQTYEWLYRALCYIHENRREWEKLMEAVDQYEELTNRSHPEYSISAIIGLKNLAALAELPEKFLLEPNITENPVGRAYHWRLLGRYRVLIKGFEAAEYAFTRSIEGFEQASARLEAGRSYIWRAELYTHIGRDEAAQADIKVAREIFEACGAKLDLKRIGE